MSYFSRLSDLHDETGDATPVSHGDLVLRASEVGYYAFCRRAWWFARVLGYRPDNQAAMATGIQFHEQLGHTLGTAQRWQSIAYSLLGLGLVTGILLLLSSCGT